jgi:hypothetical protein
LDPFETIAVHPLHVARLALFEAVAVHPLDVAHLALLEAVAVLTLDVADLALLALEAPGLVAMLHSDRGAAAPVTALLERERLALGVALALEAALLERLAAAAAALHAERMATATAATAAAHAESLTAPAATAAGLLETPAAMTAATVGLSSRLLATVSAPMTAARLRARRHRNRQRGDTGGKE